MTRATHSELALDKTVGVDLAANHGDHAKIDLVEEQYGGGGKWMPAISCGVLQPAYSPQKGDGILN